MYWMIYVYSARHTIIFILYEGKLDQARITTFDTHIQQTGVVTWAAVTSVSGLLYVKLSLPQVHCIIPN